MSTSRWQISTFPWLQFRTQTSAFVQRDPFVNNVINLCKTNVSILHVLAEEEGSRVTANVLLPVWLLAVCMLAAWLTRSLMKLSGKCWYRAKEQTITFWWRSRFWRDSFDLDLPEIIGQDSWVTAQRRHDLQTGLDGPGLSRPPSVSGAGVGRVYK